MALSNLFRLLAVLVLICVATPALAARQYKDITCATTATTGTGTVTLGAAASNYLAFSVQVTDGSTVTYGITSGDGKFETGVGVYTASGTTLTRASSIISTVGVGTKLTLSGTSTVCLEFNSVWFQPNLGTADTPTFAGIAASSNDSGAIGASGTAFSDLFLASGGVINWNAGNTTLTQSSGLLTLGGANGLLVNTTTAFKGIEINDTLDTASGGSLTMRTTSASPAASDLIGLLDFYGKDSGAADQEYGYIGSYISDATAASEDGYFTIATVTAGTLTAANVTVPSTANLAIGGEVVKKAGTETLWVPASAIIPRITNGPSGGGVEGTNVQFTTLDFDASTQEIAQFSVAMPKNWNEGTVTATFYWKHAATATNFGVVWDLACVSDSNDDAGDTAFGTAQQIADTGGTTNDIYVTSATPATTCAGTPASGDLTFFRVRRVPADGSDTMAIDAGLLGVKISYTSDAANDD